MSARTFTAAQRWVARCSMDENSCQPCKDNNGRTYRNRQQAYADYPGGKGYVRCEGRENCRCTVVKRGRASNSMDARLTAVAAGLVGSQAFSARAMANGVLARLGQPAMALDAPSGFRVERFNAAAGVNDQNNTLYLYDAIGGWDGIQAIDVVRALAGMTGDLDVHINSGGGSIFEGSAIFNAIAGYRGGEKTAYIDGVAASAASFIMLACDTVVMAANAVTMVHDGAGVAIGTANDMRDLADVLDMLSDTIAGQYARKTGGTQAEWREIMQDGDTWYNASETVAAGLADRIGDGEESSATEGADASTNGLDIGIFSVSIDETNQSPEGTAAPAAPEVPAPPTIDVAGLRDLLKGAFA